MVSVMTAEPLYCGRFAPSPTGLLHAGSLTTALGSYLEARCRGGRWLLRMEDLDTQREQPGASAAILRDLERLGFEWDGEVQYQSQRHALYRAALDQLISQQQVYRCSCTRREIQALALRGLDGWVYPGSCRNGALRLDGPGAWRFRVTDTPLMFVDDLQGPVCQMLARDIGDFVLLRADGFWAYQLAVVVDDGEQGVNHVVRGADLLVSTARQIALQQGLGLAVPTYCHLPLLVNQQGEKLSKQTRALAVSAGKALAELVCAMRRLGHTPPDDLDSVAQFWAWALENWSLTRVPHGPVVV
jgi:glutamyl-Q tRNA(Asp) synthetase